MIVIRNDKEGVINMLGTMYPSKLSKISKVGRVNFQAYSTTYGIVLHGHLTVRSTGSSYEKQVGPLEYFCITDQEAELDGTAVFFTRLGFIGQPTIGGPIETSGRLSYIDNCSDTILVYPPRFGDPSISLLSFPHNITQRFHTHPSIRMGVVVRGKGYSELGTGEKIQLEPGVAFCVSEREVHRFVTDSKSGLDVISYHPDGEWGPTDQNHTLLNRTHLGAFMPEGS